jgi:preprotein translocase subunit SecD
MVGRGAHEPGGCSPPGAKGQPPFGTEYYVERNGQPLLCASRWCSPATGSTDAQPGFDNQTHEPAVHLRLDGQGARSSRRSRARTSTSAWRSC